LDDAELTSLLSEIPAPGRDVLRRLMRAEQFERDEAVLMLLKERTEPTRQMASLIDVASTDPDVRRRLARTLGELEARDP